MMRRSLFTLVAAAAVSVPAVMAPALVSPASAQVDFNIIVGSPPPPLRYEVVPTPRAGYVWAPGHWRWDGRQHVWNQGVWVQQRAGYRYVPDRWERYMDNGHERWRYQTSRWDRDGDGIPDRYESRSRGPNGDRDHDGIPNKFDRYDNRR